MSEPTAAPAACLNLTFKLREGAFPPHSEGEPFKVRIDYVDFDPLDGSWPASFAFEVLDTAEPCKGIFFITPWRQLVKDFFFDKVFFITLAEGQITSVYTGRPLP